MVCVIWLIKSNRPMKLVGKIAYISVSASFTVRYFKKI